MKNRLKIQYSSETDSFPGKCCLGLNMRTSHQCWPIVSKHQQLPDPVLLLSFKWFQQDRDRGSLTDRVIECVAMSP